MAVTVQQRKEALGKIKEMTAGEKIAADQAEVIIDKWLLQSSGDTFSVTDLKDASKSGERIRWEKVYEELQRRYTEWEILTLGDRTNGTTMLKFKAKA